MNGDNKQEPASPGANQGGPAPLPNSSPMGPMPAPEKPTAQPAKPAVPQTPVQKPATPLPTPQVPPMPKAAPPPPPPSIPSSPPPPPPTIGGASSVPPPPPSKDQGVDVRTMASDTKSLKATGGMDVEPKSFNPEDLADDSSFPTPPVNAATKVSGNPKKRTALIAVGIVVLLALVGAAVYFFVLPLFSPSTPEVTVSEEPTTVPEDSSTPAETEPQPELVHKSFFSTPTAVNEQAVISAASLSQVNGALSSASPLVNGSLREMFFVVGEAPLTAQEFMSSAMPGMDSSVFSNDFTAFVYYDENGAWPGYVFMLNKTANPNMDTVLPTNAIEDVTDPASFYLTAVSVPDGSTFKDGTAGGIQTRYLQLDTPGASLNYGWDGDYLIISTSFQGFQKAATALAPVTES